MRLLCLAVAYSSKAVIAVAFKWYPGTVVRTKPFNLLVEPPYKIYLPIARINKGHTYRSEQGVSYRDIPVYTKCKTKLSGGMRITKIRTFCWNSRSE